jgi:hypothetical protein
MAAQREYAITGNGRRIYIASYQGGAPAEPTEPTPAPEAVPVPDQPAPAPVAGRSLRRHFPGPEDDYEGGTSDGYEYRVQFSARTWEQCYELVRAFLQDKGYADVPIPRDATELLYFRHPTRNKQVLLFADEGYVHNPLKILFPRGGKPRFKQLELRLYNERVEGHLLRFHGKR